MTDVIVAPFKYVTDVIVAQTNPFKYVTDVIIAQTNPFKYVTDLTFKYVTDIIFVNNIAAGTTCETQSTNFCHECPLSVLCYRRLDVVFVNSSVGTMQSKHLKGRFEELVRK